MQQLEAARSQLRASRHAISEHQQKESALKAKMQRMEDDREALQEALEQENVEDGRIDSLHANLKDAEDEANVHQGSLNDSTAAMSVIEDELQNIRQELAAKEVDIRQLSENSRVAQDERQRCVQKRHEIISEKNSAIARIENLQQERTGVIENLKHLKERVEDFTHKASQVFPRVPIDEGDTPKSIEQKLLKLQRDLDRHSEQ